MKFKLDESLHDYGVIGVTVCWCGLFLVVGMLIGSAWR